MEQARGIEPPTSAWKAEILPLNYACKPTERALTSHLSGLLLASKLIDFYRLPIYVGYEFIVFVPTCPFARAVESSVGIEPTMAILQTAALADFAMRTLVPGDGVEPPEPLRQRIYSPHRYPYGISRHIQEKRSGSLPQL